ncbi:transmembrane protein 60 [Schistocerca americana]|uniref:transmembrane protein 60 n=1 Tax=Schistocerca americana TaxID=7009 RepID=UPI001F4FAAC9|nr:transmembrane protein 60 [Schistocerca americana]XP_047119267.1 transmembrane protein 60 [Schistocerca piceifrons]XP_049763237.1 transmembrane protein 60 [Schistocerca cancellata]XP_049939485.1 transmembrane protein 60 [Schistocerca serialis cubense]
MAVLHRALFTWFILLVFFILLVLRLDSRTHWNWFIVFVPLWLYDLILLVYVLFYAVSQCKGHCGGRAAATRAWSVAAVTLKMTAQVVLCLALEYPSWQLSVYWVMAPLWLFLPVLVVAVFISLVRYSQY